MSKTTKKVSRVFSFVLVLTIILSSLLTSTFAAEYPDADMNITWSDNQFTNPGFECEATVWSDYIWKSISKYLNIANADKEPDSSFGDNVYPYETEVVHDGKRSIKVVETDADSYLEISKIKDYRANVTGAKPDDFRGMYLDGYTKFKLSAWYKNSANVKGVKVLMRYQLQSTNKNAFIYSEDHYFSSEASTEWEQIQTEIDMATMKATSGDNKGETLDPTIVENNAGWWFIQLIPISVDNGVLCEYYVDDIEMYYFKGATYKYRNLIADKTAACEDITEFSKNAYTTDVVRAIDNEVYHDGTGSLKVTVPGGYKALASMNLSEKLIVGEKYRFSVWYYTNDSKPGNRIFMRFATGNNTNISNWATGVGFDSAVYMNNGGWKNYTYEFTPSAVMAGDTFSNIYISTEMTSGTIYFDDFSLRRIPAETNVASLKTTDIGKVDLASPVLSVEFDKEIDKWSFPSRVTIDGNLVSVSKMELAENGRELAVTLAASPSVGKHTLTLSSFKDVWGRAIANQTATFEIVRGNLFKPSVAACDDLTEFTANAYSGSPDVVRAIDNEVYNSGNSSLKITVPGGYKALASMVPVEKLDVNKKYVFSVWYYTEDAAKTNRIFMRFATGNNTNISNWATGVGFDSAQYMNNGGWKNYKYEFTPSAVMAGSTFSNIYISTEMTSGTIYFDDFSLRMVEPITVSADVYGSAEATAPVEGWQSGDLVAKAVITNPNYDAANYKCTVVFANYDGTTLKNVKIKEFNESVPGNGSKTVPVELTVTEGDTLKVFVWDSASTLLPLIPNVVK